MKFFYRELGMIVSNGIARKVGNEDIFSLPLYEETDIYKTQQNEYKKNLRNQKLEALEKSALRPLIAAFHIERQIKESGSTAELSAKLEQENIYFKQKVALIESARNEK